MIKVPMYYKNSTNKERVYKKGGYTFFFLDVCSIRARKKAVNVKHFK